jgi:hypothetical protein
MLFAQLFLSELIERNIYGDGVLQYRVKNVVTDTYVTSLSSFISGISEDYIKA